MKKNSIAILFILLPMAASLEEPLLLWKFKTSDEIKSSPLIYDNTIYVSSMDNYTYAIDSKLGSLKWKFKTLDPIEESPIAGEEVIYIYSGSNIYCIDPEGGRSRWEFTSSGKISAVKVHDAGVYIGTEYGYIYSLNSTGKSTWKVEADGKIMPMEIANNILYAAGGMYLYAIEREKGAIIWKYQTSGIVSDKPIVLNKTLYAVAGRGGIYALDAANGTLIWSFRAGDTIAAAPAVNEDMIYIGSNDYHVYALNASNGSLLWKTKLQDYAVAPFIEDGIIYVKSGWYIWALHAINGTSIWNYHASSQLFDPVIYDGTLYVGEASGNLTALNAKNGELKWQFKTSGIIRSRPIAAKEIIYLNSGDSYTYALKIATSAQPTQTPTPISTPQPTKTPTLTLTPTNITIISETPKIIREKSTPGFEFLLAIIAIITFHIKGLNRRT